VTIIVTEEEMLEWECFKKMQTQGHQILALDSLAYPADPPLALVMGSRAHLLLPGMEAMIPVALKAARSRLRG
jgi:hypothetical protein